VRIGEGRNGRGKKRGKERGEREEERGREREREGERGEGEFTTKNIVWWIRCAKCCAGSSLTHDTFHQL
jgi:hypothetical protein